MTNDWKNNLISKLSIRKNKVCIKGTRIMISIILDCLVEGLSENEIYAGN